MGQKISWSEEEKRWLRSLTVQELLELKLLMAGLLDDDKNGDRLNRLKRGYLRSVKH